MKLTADLIYEAAIDDELFAQFPAIISTALEARSCTLHWRDSAGTAGVAGHSGYFSDADMADYAFNFAAHDLWTDAGMRAGFVNRAWNTSGLVPLDEYARSIFYNEWIRAIGDDTYYCCGSVMRTSEGFGMIGLHRGRTQSDFSPETLAELNAHVDHLRRMFTIRGRLSHLADRNDLLSAIFESPRQAAFLVGGDARLVMANAQADTLLARRKYLRLRGGKLEPASDAGQSVFEAALAAAHAPADRRASSCLLRGNDGTFVTAAMTPIVGKRSASAVLVTIEAPAIAAHGVVVSRHLQDAFGLSAAEADIAIRLAEGDTITEIGERRRSAPGTVRTQVKHILSKMHARRQGDVVRIVGRIAAGRPVGNDLR
ncbi:hypothetical protein H9L13_03785 [Sphingomonas lutea]|uniref:HTH luxR-type domain-containing protein n=1 Tax=Sphingomonas lutea TaxID=1045317 RepID=A0A7G9SJL0_9SPHN|nr:hypothetical protein [Sphingomonas lutea]QNN68035.1 hypothetical protein H9L13_03785 [Sphingomonas lutea]